MRLKFPNTPPFKPDKERFIKSQEFRLESSELKSLSHLGRKGVWGKGGRRGSLSTSGATNWPIRKKKRHGFKPQFSKHIKYPENPWRPRDTGNSKRSKSLWRELKDSDKFKKAFLDFESLWKSCQWMDGCFELLYLLFLSKRHIHFQLLLPCPHHPCLRLPTCRVWLQTYFDAELFSVKSPLKPPLGQLSKHHLAANICQQMRQLSHNYFVSTL